PDVRLAARAGRLDGVDGQPGGGRHEEGSRVQDRTAISRLPPQPRVLHDVLGLDRTAEHAVRDAEQPRPRTDEGRKGAVICGGLHSTLSPYGYHGDPVVSPGIVAYFTLPIARARERLVTRSVCEG